MKPKRILTIGTIGILMGGLVGCSIPTSTTPIINEVEKSDPLLQSDSLFKGQVGELQYDHSRNPYYEFDARDISFTQEELIDFYFNEFQESEAVYINVRVNQEYGLHLKKDTGAFGYQKLYFKNPNNGQNYSNLDYMLGIPNPETDDYFFNDDDLNGIIRPDRTIEFSETNLTEDTAKLFIVNSGQKFKTFVLNTIDGTTLKLGIQIDSTKEEQTLIKEINQFAATFCKSLLASDLYYQLDDVLFYFSEIGDSFHEKDVHTFIRVTLKDLMRMDWDNYEGYLIY